MWRVETKGSGAILADPGDGVRPPTSPGTPIQPQSDLEIPRRVLELVLSLLLILAGCALLYIGGDMLVSTPDGLVALKE